MIFLILIFLPLLFMLCSYLLSALDQGEEGGIQGGLAKPTILWGTYIFTIVSSNMIKVTTHLG